MGSPSTLASDLDFAPGAWFRHQCLVHFGKAIHHPSECLDGSFLLLVSFPRFCFRLTEESMGLALRACLGGSAPSFHVSQISHQVFKFAVSCKQVGLFVYSLKSYSCDKFMVRFDLWRDGGANYRREFARWNRECLAEWTTVSHTHQPRTSNRVSFADKLIQDSPPIKHKPRNLSIKFGQFCCPMDFSSPQKNLFFGFRAADVPSSGMENSPTSKHLTHVLRPERSSRPLQNSNSANGCLNCFADDHSTRSCSNPPRCKVCFNYGHLSFSCLHA